MKQKVKHRHPHKTTQDQKTLRQKTYGKFNTFEIWKKELITRKTEYSLHFDKFIINTHKINKTE